MNKYVLGRVVPIYRGEWSCGTVYEQLDVVFFNGSSYVSLRDLNENKQPDTHGEYWGLLAQSAEVTEAQIDSIVERVTEAPFNIDCGTFILET